MTMPRSRRSRIGARRSLLHVSANVTNVTNGQELLNIAISLAADVANGVRKRARQARMEVRLKDGHAGPVTSADEWAERTLAERILEQRPNDGVLGEEGTSVAGQTGVTWVIDPIDGTTNFVYDLPGSAVSVGVEVDGVALAGVVVDLTRGDLFSACRGSGARRNKEHIHPSDMALLGRALVGTGIHPDHTRRERQADVLRHVLPRIGDLRRLGGCALDICSVACGRLDGFYDLGLKPWDLSASLLIATEAGATVTRLGSHTDGLVVCTSPGIHDELVEAVLCTTSAQRPSGH